MMDDKALFDYWHQRVELRNTHLLDSPEHLKTPTLRHEYTNYDDLRFLREVQQLDELERSKVIAIIKYECTAKVLQHRASRLRDRANKLEDACNELDEKKTSYITSLGHYRKSYLERIKRLKG
ncbi:hypothetical protein [Leptodesmis sichuanensis]|uniref:hypothetical protein n=1 Tax=Leptodesmis sichuanensis TaxID=2906798 RepID=UPI001F2804AF|nr:hypothetical protein [Leptodesmis sichuanensis]UIE36011.1 hypothetical protein KIK02_13015 [Leptodesmis sichuanensis A121]